MYGDAGIGVLEGTFEGDEGALAVGEGGDEVLGQFEGYLLRRREVSLWIVHRHLEIIKKILPIGL